MPLLVDKEAVGPSGLRAIQSMMVMRPTPDFQPGAGFVDVRAGASLGAGGRYMPAVTAAWRLRLLAGGNMPDAQLARVRCGAQPEPCCGACVDPAKYTQKYFLYGCPTWHGLRAYASLSGLAQCKLWDMRHGVGERRSWFEAPASA